ncbi:MAG: hypothetical protein RL516_620 [Bacteroidota bacterium]|jgi:hypothetical protein
MGLIKEPKNIDLSTMSEPWSEEELKDFRLIMQKIKLKNSRRKSAVKKSKSSKKQIA